MPLWKTGLDYLARSLALAAVAIAYPLPALAQIPDVPVNVDAARSAYLLGAGDQVAITVFGYEEYTGSQAILSDGTIALPLLGSVVAAGQTTDSLAQEITRRLQPYLVDPVVSVSLTTLRPVIVNVAGEVRRPGPVQLRSITSPANPTPNQQGTTTGGVPTLSSALVQAGGITPNADIRKVVVRRIQPGGQTAAIELNLWDAIWSDAAPEDIILQAGDSIFVPSMAEGETIDRRLLARSSLSPGTVRVRVVGEVIQPGQVEVAPDSSLSGAIAIAGGPTEDARMSRVALLRLDEAGGIATQEIDLSDLNDNLQVQEGDVIVVPERGTSSFLRVLGQVLTPAGSLLGIIERIFN